MLQNFALHLSSAWGLLQAVNFRKSTFTMTLSKILAASLLGVASLSSEALAQSAKDALCEKFPDARVCGKDTPAPEDPAAEAPAPDVKSGALPFLQRKCHQASLHPVIAVCRFIDSTGAFKAECRTP